MTPNPDTLKRLTKARATLLIEQPFYGALALRLQLVANNDIKTAGVDGTHIFYNEAFVESLPIDQLRTLLAHEVGHCVFQHVGRRGARDHQRWNVAGDYVINDMLLDSNFTPIPGWCHDRAYKGMSSDQVYNLLPTGEGRLPKPLDEIMDGPPRPGGTPKHFDKSEITVLENDWTVATLQAANAAKQRGKLPASLERFVKDLTEAKVNWRDQLRAMFTEHLGKDDYSWMRPNRRMQAYGLILPGLYSETVGTVVVVTDDSGSVGAEMLVAFSAEIKAIRSAVIPAKTIHISCDAAINHLAEFLPEDAFEIVSKGGGGTCFRPPFKHLADEGTIPAVLVYLTDGYGSFPAEPPNYPVMWVMTTDVVAPFGETIRIEV
jgi:predicted metal-dependent peptidase